MGLGSIVLFNLQSLRHTSKMRIERWCVCVKPPRSVTLKPAKGLSGTVSFNIHDDGNATILVYESIVNIEANIKEKLRLLILKAMNGCLSQNSYNHIKKYNFTLSLAHTVQGVTKNVSSKRINKEALKVIMRIIMLNPDVNLKYVEEQI